MTRLAAQLYSSIFVHPLSVLIEPLYQPKVRDLARSGSKIASVPFGIAARLKDRFLARDWLARLDLARGSACSRSGSARGSAHCSSGLGSPRLDSAWLGSARLGSAGYSGFDSFLFLAQTRFGASAITGSGIYSMLDSAQLGAWLWLSSAPLGLAHLSS